MKVTETKKANEARGAACCIENEKTMVMAVGKEKRRRDERTRRGNTLTIAISITLAVRIANFQNIKPQ